MLDACELAYFAGFFDGEGCITHTQDKRTRFPGVRVVVSQRNPAPLLRLQELYGGSLAANAHGHRVVYAWAATPGAFVPFLTDILPYLRLKRAEAAAALAYQALSPGASRRPRTEAEKKLRQDALDNWNAVRDTARSVEYSIKGEINEAN